MHLPDEFIKLFDWIESVGGIGTSVGDDPFAVIDPRQVGRKGGSPISFFELCEDPLWLGTNNINANLRLRPFMSTGSDGSTAAFWLDDYGKQRIVHLGSGSGSIMIGTWVSSPLEFLTLLAIGYEELCWPEDYSKKPIECALDKGRYLEPTQYQKWLVNTYDITIPGMADEIVKEMSELGEQSDDPFCLWLKSVDSNK